MKYLAGSIMLMLGLIVMAIGAPFVIIGELSRNAAGKIAKLADEFVNGSEKGGIE